MAGQSLALLVGVPLAAWMGTWLSWRGVHQVVAGVAVLGLVVAYRWKSGWAVPVLIGLAGLIGAAMLGR